MVLQVCFVLKAIRNTYTREETVAYLVFGKCPETVVVDSDSNYLKPLTQGESVEVEIKMKYICLFIGTRLQYDISVLHVGKKSAECPQYLNMKETNESP